MGESASEARGLELERGETASSGRIAVERAHAERDAWREVFAALPEPAIVTNGYGLIREANGAAARALGVARDALRGRALHAFVARGDARTLRGALGEVRREGTLVLELRLRPQPARGAWTAEARAVALRGDERGIVWTLRDASASADARALRTRIASLEAMNAWASKVIDELAGGDGAQALRRESVDLGAAVARAAASLADRARAREVAIDVAAPAGDPLVFGDPRRLEEMLRLLLGEAIDHAPRGAVVPIAAGRGAGGVVVSLRGVRFPGSSTVAAIARAIVALHGGTMRGRPDETGETGDTEMTITFPIEEGFEPRYEDDAVDDADYADLSGIRVVVVEDDVDARDMLIEVLVAQGADVRGAANGVDAIDLVQEWRPDVLVSDIGLPDMDGYTLIRRVRQLGEAGGSVPAIALTGYADIEDSRRALAAGYQVHVAKPIDASLLTHAVANVAGVPIDA